MSLPTHVDPRKLAQQDYLLEGELGAENLPRLASSVESICSPLKATIRFSVDESKAKIACGSASVSVMAICQRCLDEVKVDLHATFAVQIIWSDDKVQHVARNYEPWLVSERTADLSELLEDEILLSLPLVNYHPAGACTGDAFIASVDSDIDVSESDNPFSILKQLKQLKRS
jgi:uncharacterized protein